jgi:hypothetical protein
MASSEPSSDNVEDPMTQSDLTMSQSTFQASQEPAHMEDADLSFQGPEDTVAASRFESTQLGIHHSNPCIYIFCECDLLIRRP